MLHARFGLPILPPTVAVVAGTRNVGAVPVRPLMPSGRGDLEGVGKMYGMHDGAVALSDRGFWLPDGDFSTHDEAFGGQTL
jgi:hypothetical protein